jgi:cation:H+ antiporter
VIGWLLVAGAAVLLLSGAELFVENAAGAARRLGVTVIAVGVLLAGAEPEELLTAVIASLHDRPGLAVGDALGANVTMLTACLGLAALVRPLPVGRRVRQYTGMAAVSAALAVLVLFDGRVGRLEGALLLAAYGALVAVVWWREREPPALGERAEVDDDEHPDRSPARSMAFAVAGLAMMLVGGDLAVRGAERLVDSLGRSDSAVGLTVLALATTAELFALVLTAARHDVPEIAVAGVVGSAAYNATATLGAAALARPLAVHGVLPAAALGVALPVLLLVVTRRGRLVRAVGAGLIVTYLGFVVLVLT